MSSKSKRGRVIVVTSGKGGVGKTTTSASLATGLALKGKKTIAIDFDIGLRNLDLIFGCDNRVMYDIIQVMNNEVKLHQACISLNIKDTTGASTDKNLFCLPASQTSDKTHLNVDKIGALIEKLRDKYDYIICDSPAGCEDGALMAMHFADEAVVVVNPEISSIRDSDRIIGHLDTHTVMGKQGLKMPQNLVITRYNAVPESDMISIDQITDILRIDVIGVIPESKDIIASSNVGIPAIANQKNVVGQAYMDVVERILGNDLPLRFLNANRKGFFRKLFGAK
jgi:septum site-determining protein MinD